VFSYLGKGENKGESHDCPLVSDRQEWKIKIGTPSFMVDSKTYNQGN